MDEIQVVCQKSGEKVRVIREQNDQIKRQLVGVTPGIEQGPRRSDPELRRPPPESEPQGMDPEAGR